MQLKLILGLLLASIAPAWAQTAFTCVGNSSTTPILRNDGVTEKLGEIVINCGGAEAPIGTMPTFDIQVFFSVPVTSRILNPTYQLSEALLLVDEPGSVTPPTGVQIACDSFGNTTVPGSACNVHPGILIGTNSIKWTNIPLYPAPGSQLRILRLVNLRGSIQNLLSSTLIPTAVTAWISVLGQNPPAFVNPQLTVGYVLAPLQMSIRDASNSVELLDGAHYDRCCSVNPDLTSNPPGSTLTETTSFVARVSEGFGTTLLRRSDGETWPNADSPVFAPTPQNVIGSVYTTETGFYNPAFPAVPDGLDRAGLATQGTRFYLRFYNVPVGVTLYSGLYALGATTANSPVRRIVNETGPFVPASATVSTAGPYAPLTLVEPGVHEAIYQVTGLGDQPYQILNYDIPILVAYSGASVTTAVAQLQVGLAPRDGSEDPTNQTMPRFGVSTQPLTRRAFEVSGSSLASVSIAATRGAFAMTAPFTVQGAAECQPGSYQTPKTFSWTIGASCTVNFPDETIDISTGVRARRAGWSDGPSGSSRTISVTNGSHAYTMTYAQEVLAKAAVNPSGCGTNTFQGGATQRWVSTGTQVTATATVASTCSFQGFSSNRTSSLSYQNPYSLNIYSPTTVVANFSQGAPRMALSTYSKSGAANARVFNIVLRNAGTANAVQPGIAAATVVQSMGTRCSPVAHVTSSLPVAGPATLAPGATATYPVQLDFSGCTGLPIATPFRLTLTVTTGNAAAQTIAITTAR